MGAGVTATGGESSIREYPEIFDQYMIQRTIYARPVRIFSIGIMQHAAQTHIAIPSVFPGSGSAFAIPRARISFPRDFPKAITTKKCHIRLKRGINKSQTRPGSIVLDAGEHFFNARERVRL